MRIKKHKNKNDYLLSSVGGIWIRNTYKENVRPIDINKLIKREDYDLFIENEIFAKRMRLPWILNDLKTHENIVIISDGMEFSKKQKVLAELPPKKFTVIAVNGALSNWTMVGDLSEHQRRIDYYVVNNPYPECMKFMPIKHRYFPHCISSTRTNKNFLKKYQGNKLLYHPVCDKEYTGVFNDAPQSVDDYRNPICAAITIAGKFKVKKLFLLCCDDTLKEHRPATERTHDGYWRYPQQEISEAVIDSCLYWLSKCGTEIGYHSMGAKYKNATYIEMEGILEFFERSNG